MQHLQKYQGFCTTKACALLSSAKPAHANGGISAPDAVTGTNSHEEQQNEISILLFYRFSYLRASCSTH